MPTTPTTETRPLAVTRDATKLVENIEQVAHWVPTQDPGRQALLASVTEMKRRLEGEALSRGEVLSFQVSVWKLQGQPFKTLLSRRVVQLGELYGLHSH